MSCKIDSSRDLMMVKYWGFLTNEDVKEVAEATLNFNGPTPLHRMEDLRDLQSIKLGYDDMLEFKDKIGSSGIEGIIKSAMVTGNPLQYGVARMLQTMLDNPVMKIEIFTEEEKALEWLSSSD